MDPATIGIAISLAKYAPQLIKWVTGNEKAAEAAEAVVDVAKEITGSATGEAAIDVLATNPELVIQFRSKVLETVIELERAQIEDIQNARAMQIAALQQDDLFSKRFAYYFASIWSMFTMVYFGCVTFMSLNTTNVRFADTILGFLLGTAIASIFSWLYGTTVRNAKKDETMNTLSSLLK